MSILSLELPKIEQIIIIDLRSNIPLSKFVYENNIIDENDIKSNPVKYDIDIFIQNAIKQAISQMDLNQNFEFKILNRKIIKKIAEYAMNNNFLFKVKFDKNFINNKIISQILYMKGISAQLNKSEDAKLWFDKLNN